MVQDDEELKLRIGQMIRRERIKQSLTQMQLAEESGVQTSSIANYELGKTLPSIRNLHKLADAFGCRLVIKFVDWD